MKSNVKSPIARYTEEDETYWRNHLSAFNSSGLTRVIYCKQHHVNYDRFAYWKKKLLDNALQAKSQNGVAKSNTLVPITLKAETSTTMTQLCSLQFKNGCILQIYDVDVLTTLLSRMV